MLKKRILIILFLLTFLVLGPVCQAYAEPYNGYNYSYGVIEKPAPVPYLPVKQINGTQLKVGEFKSPEDIYITAEGSIYVLDTGNKRIVCLDRQWSVVRIIDRFINNGREDTFSNPCGIFVNGKNHIFVADTDNQRIVELAANGEFVRKIGKPVSDILPDGFKYAPVKVAADEAGRLYVVSKGALDGIMEFNSSGQFTGFMGVNPVKFSAADFFWKKIATKEQKKGLNLFVPVEFNNLDIDGEGFIYATTADADSKQPIRRLNPSGIDVLRRAGHYPPVGDLQYPTMDASINGPSIIVSVTADKYGIYSILDSKRGRVFTYDRDGILLYEFGSLGEKEGNFKSPAEVAMLDDEIVVLDRGLNNITVFGLTRYGKAVRGAVIYSDKGDSAKSVAAWREALKINSNLEQAYIGIGKSELARGENDKAIQSFKQGMNEDYYSRAFARYRKDFLWNNFSLIAILAILFVIVFVTARRVLKEILPDKPGVLRTGWHLMFRPIKGFWELKYEKKGQTWYALLIIILLTVVLGVGQKYSGFIVNPLSTDNIDGFAQLKYVALPFLLWCVANWSLTTLMDGEGKFGEIVMATGYALQPMLIIGAVEILYSQVITIEEVAFYNLLNSIAVIWFIWLLFAGMMTIHQYNVKKTIATMALTVVVMGIIVFLGLLVFSLAQQMVSFVLEVYQELLFRFMEG